MNDLLAKLTRDFILVFFWYIFQAVVFKAEHYPSKALHVSVDVFWSVTTGRGDPIQRFCGYWNLSIFIISFGICFGRFHYGIARQ